jgi:hypothetical protein
MIASEIRNGAAGSLTQLIVNTGSVEIVRNGIASAIDIAQYVSTVVNKFRGTCSATGLLNTTSERRRYRSPSRHLTYLPASAGSHNPMSRSSFRLRRFLK